MTEDDVYLIGLTKRLRYCAAPDQNGQRPANAYLLIETAEALERFVPMLQAWKDAAKSWSARAVAHSVEIGKLQERCATYEEQIIRGAGNEQLNRSSTKTTSHPATGAGGMK